MRAKTLKKCARRAKALAHQHHDHPTFSGYTESEVATGGTVALAILKDYVNHKHAGRLPMPDEDIDRLCAAIGLDDMEKGDFDRVMNVCEMLLDLLKIKTEKEKIT